MQRPNTTASSVGGGEVFGQEMSELPTDERMGDRLEVGAMFALDGFPRVSSSEEIRTMMVIRVDALPPRAFLSQMKLGHGNVALAARVRAAFEARSGVAFDNRLSDDRLILFVGDLSVSR